MFGSQGGNRGKHLEKILHLFSQMPDKEDQKDGGRDEASEGKSSPLGEGGQVGMLGGQQGPMASIGNDSSAHVPGIDPHQRSSFDIHDHNQQHKVGRR